MESKHSKSQKSIHPWRLQGISLPRLSYLLLFKQNLDINFVVFQHIRTKLQICRKTVCQMYKIERKIKNNYNLY